LKKTLGPVSLTALGIGIVIGSGIFTVIGTAIGGNPAQKASWSESPVIDLIIGALHHTSGVVAGRPGAGPALVISLVLVAIVCALTGLCYAELASMIPIAGSAYTYTYATMGELVAWIIGWDLILEYAFANMSVSVGFAAHLVDLLDWLGIHLDPKWLSPAYLPQGLQDLAGKDIYAPGMHFGFDIPAFLIVLILTVLLVLGIRESSRTNNAMVLIKIGAILTFVFFGISFIHPSNYHPFSPNGWSGILAGGSIIFFTYIGFDAVSTASEECKKPQRDVPIGIIATLIVCTILYIGVAAVLTGMVDWKSVAGDGAPIVNALKRVSLLPGAHRLHWVRLAVLFGAILGMISSILVGQYGQARIWFAMSPAALGVQQGASAVSHTGVCHDRRGHPGRNSGGLVRCGHTGRDVEYRHAVCVRARVNWRDGAALQGSRAASGISGSARSRHSGAQRPVLFPADGRPADAHVDPFFRVAGDRACGLRNLQP
jgi:APA family basic amino acid/polyamine antiporter